MADIPKWLLPAGLALATGLGLLASRRMVPAGPKAGDVVSVPLLQILAPADATRPERSAVEAHGAGLTAAVPGGIALVELDFAQGGQLRGRVTGYVDPATRMPQTVLGGGIGPVSFSAQDVQDIFRGTPLRRV